jgi:hypothetical protein
LLLTVLDAIAYPMIGARQSALESPLRGGQAVVVQRVRGVGKNLQENDPDESQ